MLMAVVRCCSNSSHQWRRSNTKRPLIPQIWKLGENVIPFVERMSWDSISIAGHYLWQNGEFRRVGFRKNCTNLGYL
ncbi:hypothetical protein Csa_016486 [Cucumis sativus]|uniref:Uncharacterized protein n=1 Tax=Cucumis sativus TaxID=3659 RepID=A0A0A0KCM6_CUCSA|nr:hypothetical protein Csa_016486 [Cucumis sativus]